QAKRTCERPKHFKRCTFWRFLRASIKEKYTKQDWLKSLNSEENILKLLFYINIQKPVKKDEKLDGTITIEDIETSGLIFLKQCGKLFIPRAPLISKTFNSFVRPGLLDGRKLPVIFSNKEGYKEIDVMSGRYTVLIARRTIHTNSTGKIGVDLILDEEKRASATGCNRFALVTPKTMDVEDIKNIPDNCIIMAGKDLINFIALYRSTRIELG
ncbi:19789_t:CDS:2, partial [Dentiscutata erythropus]